MYKKILKNFVLAITIFFGFNLYVSADSIYDNLQSGDIIIGNTTFRSGTWISATRASKAGSLYTKNTGDTNARTFLYINKNVWFELDEEGQYNILTSTQITEIEENLNIYYDNNEGIMHTYDAYTYFKFLSYNLEYDDIDVTFNYEEETVTCPYGKTFDFIDLDDLWAEPYTGICGLDGKFLIEDSQSYNRTELDVIDIELVDNENFLNQDKITLNQFNNEYNTLSFKINEELEYYEMEEDYYTRNLVFNIKFAEGNDISYYDFIVTESNRISYEIEKDFENNMITIYIEPYEFIQYNNFIRFLVIDYNKEKFEYISINSMGLDKDTADIELIDIGIANVDDFEIEELINNNNKYDSSTYNVEEQYADFNFVGELEEFDGGKWIMLELQFPTIKYPSQIEVLTATNSNLNYNYFIYDDKLYLSVDYSTINENYNFLNIKYNYTTGESNYNLKLSIDNYVEENSISYDSQIQGIYNVYPKEDSDIKVDFDLVEKNSSSYDDIYYSNNKLYYEDESVLTHGVIFKDQESFKYIFKNSNTNEIEVKEVVGFLYDVTTGVFSYRLADSTINSFEGVLEHNTIAEDHEYILYYFFNRYLTANEETTLISLATDYDNVELVNLSDYYYNNKIAISNVVKVESIDNNNQDKLMDVRYDEENNKYNVYLLEGLEDIEYNSKTGKYLFFEVEFDEEVDITADKVSITPPTNHYSFVEDNKLILAIEYDKDNSEYIIPNIHIVTPGNHGNSIKFNFIEYSEENSVNFSRNVLGNYVITYNESDDSLSLEEVDVNSNSISSAISHNGKLYYNNLDENGIIIKTNVSFQTIYIEDSTIKTKFIDGILYYSSESKEIDTIKYKLIYSGTLSNTLDIINQYYEDYPLCELKMYYFSNDKTTETENILNEIKKIENVEFIDESYKYYKWVEILDVTKYESDSLNELNHNQDKILGTKIISSKGSPLNKNYSIYTLGELETFEYNGLNQELIFINVEINTQNINLEDLVVESSVKNLDFDYFIENNMLVLVIENLEFNVSTASNILYFYISGSEDVLNANLTLYINNYNEENYISYEGDNVIFPYGIADIRYYTDLPLMEEQTTASHNFYDIYYDSVNKKIYYKSDFVIGIFKDNSGFKYVSKEPNNYNIKDLNYVLYDTTNNTHQYGNAKGFDSIKYTISNNSTTNYVLYYLFNRELTNEEKEALEELTTYENLEIYDVSEKYYG